MSYGQYSLHEKPIPPAKPEKEKKLKAVFETNEVPHVWAHPDNAYNAKYPVEGRTGYAQTHARNPQNNLFFNTASDGTRILYSYRESYPIGSRFTIGKGKKSKVVFLVRSGKPFSVTTSAHMSACAQAARNNGEVFHVPYVTRYSFNKYAVYAHSPSSERPDKATHAANLKAYAEEIASYVAMHEKARSTWSIEGSHTNATRLAAEVRKYAKLFKLKLPKLTPVPTLDARRIEQARARRAHLDATKLERQRALDEKRALEHAEQTARWKAGEETTPYYGARYDSFAFLRVVDTPGQNGFFQVETSQGVKVPVLGRTGAASLLRFLGACKQNNRPYKSNGHTQHIGQFDVRSFGPEPEIHGTPDNPNPEWLLVAGCHTIKWSEVLTIADEVRRIESQEEVQS